MIRESTCKINLGLNVTCRRVDGFHEIVTLMYPVRRLFDIIEMVESDTFEFSTSGLTIDCPMDKNLTVKAFRLMQGRFGIGEARIHLHKIIPTGAGLGGGSANATTVIIMCNEMWNLGLTVAELQSLAAELGSDTPFFVLNSPQLATGRGEILEPFTLSLSGLWLMMIKPDMGVSTAEAYSGVTPNIAIPTVQQALQSPIESWAELLRNDFEPSVFEKIPLLATLKSDMYAAGALYAAMSGSGSTIFGLFDKCPEPPTTEHFIHVEQL